MTTSRRPIRIRHAARRLAAIIESSSDAIFAENLNGIITDWNEGRGSSSDTLPKKRLAAR